MSHNRKYVPSRVKIHPIVSVYKCLFIISTAASHRPPKLEALGGIKCHSIRFWVKPSEMCGFFLSKNPCSSFNALAAPMKFLSLFKIVDFVPKPEYEVLVFSVFFS